jgi:hypothetical protein
MRLPVLKKEALRYFDGLLSQLLNHIGHEDYVFVVSNHSLIAGRNHNNSLTDPILFARGPGVPKRKLVFGATIADIAPTILTIFGIDPSDGMDGRSMDNLLADAPRQSLRRIDHNKPGPRRRDGIRLDVSALEEATLERMRRLGYFVSDGGP